MGKEKRRMNTRKNICLVVVVSAIISGCSTVPSRPVPPKDLASIPDAVPKLEPRSTRGNPDSYKEFGKRYWILSSPFGYVARGKASWYGGKFHGRETSSGEIYDMYAMTAAHKRLPLPSYVEVRNLENGRSAVVRVNDRGPFHGNRIIDLSYAAASKLGMTRKGTALVVIRVIDPRNPQAHKQRIAKQQTTPRTESLKNPRIYIQVGAFGNPDNATRLRQRLEGHLQRNIRIENGGHVHRVQIGPLASVEIADQVVDRLEDIDIYETQLLLR